MKAVILAAGRGERMMPLTAKTPKPLLKINGKCLIDYVLDSLPYEIDEVIIVVKYLGNQIKKHVGKKNRGLKIKYVEGSDKGNVYSFLNTKKYLHNERFLLIYGDEIPNRHSVEDCLREKLCALFFKENDDWKMDGVMVLNTKIFKYKPTDNNFSTLASRFYDEEMAMPVHSMKFIGNINTPTDLKRAERELKHG